MIASIKSIDLIDHDNWNYCPDDVTDFCVAAEAIIGLEESEGGDIFSFEVCSPTWLERRCRGKANFIRHVLVVNEYEETAIKSAVNDLVRGICGENWAEIAKQLARHMFWEFEDYDPYYK